jgi:ubiquinone biosynthesis monooxygenase Coq7
MMKTPATHPVESVAQPQRPLRLLDRLIGEFDAALRTVGGVTPASREYPGTSVEETVIDPRQRREVAALMRVNHAGEIAAQALYQGQALTARTPDVREALNQAASEETDHLVWCAHRIEELGDRVSLLNPLWYAGSFAIGALAGLAGDRVSLGFVAETERQVVEHLESHLERLPGEDRRTRAVIEQMRRDEEHHGAVAKAAGGADLPVFVQRAMRLTAKVMTSTAARF